MSNVISMDRDMLTEVMAQVMMRANQQRFGLPSRAEGEQSNILNYTEYYNLPLPTGNEVIAYQDFINDANNIIDGALHTIQNTLDTVSTTANNAADGVAAADTKINELVQDNINNEVATLPQFKLDTDDRLESLENDVMGLTGWSRLFLKNGNITNEVLVSSIGIWLMGGNCILSENYTERQVNYITNTPINFHSPVRIRLYTAPNNPFNLEQINVYYIYPFTGILSTGGIASYYVALIYTGSETRLDIVTDSNEEVTFRILSTFIPFTRKN